MGRSGGGCGIVKTHIPEWATHKQEDNYNFRVLPKEQGV